MNYVYKLNAFLMLSFALSICHAGQPVSPPHEVIKKTTEALIDLIERGKGKNKQGLYYKKPQQFFAELEALVDPLVDFNQFTRVVMGEYGTRAYYQSLDAKQKAQFKQDYRGFVKEFRKGLINTYGKGLMVFNGQKVIVEPVKKSDWSLIEKGEMVDVTQRIVDKGKVHRVILKMRPDNKGNWLLRNMIIDSINLGELYQNQFKGAMKKYKGNFSLVVENWATEIESTKNSIK